MATCNDTSYVLSKLAWLRTEGIWPNGRRYLWTDAFGVVLLVSLHAQRNEQRYLDEAQWLATFEQTYKIEPMIEVLRRIVRRHYSDHWSAA